MKKTTNRGPRPGYAKGNAGKGRRKGVKNKVSRIMMTEMLLQTGQHKISPLSFMLGVLNNPKMTMARRQWAAEKAAPYVHKKMPLQLEGGSPDRPIVMAVQDQLKTYTPEEFAILQKLNSRVRKALPSPDDVMKMIGKHIAEKEAAEEEE